MKNPKINPIDMGKLMIREAVPITIVAIANPFKAFGSSFALINAIIPKINPMVETNGIKKRKLNMKAVIVRLFPIID